MIELSGTHALLSFNMKSSLFILLCSGLLALVAGFTKDDHEIFRLRDEIQASEGPEVTFYGNCLYWLWLTDSN